MKKLTAAAALILALPILAHAQNVAIVNGKAVPKTRVETLLKQVARQGQPVTPELEQRVKDEVVLREIFMQEAQRQGIGTSDTYKEQMELARQAIMIRTLFETYQKTHPVTDAEVQAEYDKFKAQAGEKEYRTRHILVPSEDEAKELIAKLKAGAKFEDLAKAHSKDPGSGANGGDLDWAAPGNFVPEFSDAMVKLEKGSVTDVPVKSQFGFHIIRLDDVREAQIPSLDELKPQIQQRLGQDKMAKFQENLKTKARTDYKFGGQ